MSQTSIEIDAAVALLGLGDEQFCRVKDGKAADVFASLEATFVAVAGRRWLWEVFHRPASSVTFADQKAFARLPRVVPDPEESLWFVVEDDGGNGFLVYECSASVATRVIGECFGFEYYLVDRSMRWLVCENHHDRLIAVGGVAVCRLRALAAAEGLDLFEVPA